MTEDEKCLRNMAHEFEEGFNSGAEYTEKGKPGKDEGRYVTIWKHQKDGSWKLSMDMGVPQE